MRLAQLIERNEVYNESSVTDAKTPCIFCGKVSARGILLLCAVGGVFGVIQVQNEMLGRNLVRGDETVHQGVSQTAKIFGGKRILKPGDLGLTVKVLLGRKPATGHFG